MEHDLWSGGAVVFALLMLSAFLSCTETALSFASAAKLLAADKDDVNGNGTANKILIYKDHLLSTLFFFNALTNFAAMALMTILLSDIWGNAGIIISIVVMTILIFVLSGLIPKMYAAPRADKLVILLAPSINFLMTLMTPVINLISFALPKRNSDQNLEALRGAIEMHQGEEEEVQRQRVMLRSILDLAEVSVGEVMIHRKNVVSFDAASPTELLIDEVYNSPYSRIPLWRDRPDNIVGLVHTKWVLRELKAVNNDPAKVNLEMISAEPWFIPESTSLYEQLQAFRERGEHFAFVVDEYGSYLGIVTLEDILEEIVGEINDEHDIHIPGLRRQPNGTYLVTGSVTIRDLHRELEWDDLPDEDYTTLAGLILHESQRVPDVGQSFMFYNYRFDIVRRHRNQITLVRITPPQ